MSRKARDRPPFFTRSLLRSRIRLSESPHPVVTRRSPAGGCQALCHPIRVPLRQVFLGHASPTTTQRYDLARDQLDRSPAYALWACSRDPCPGRPAAAATDTAGTNRLRRGSQSLMRSTSSAQRGPGRPRDSQSQRPGPARRFTRAGQSLAAVGERLHLPPEVVEVPSAVSGREAPTSEPVRRARPALPARSTAGAPDARLLRAAARRRSSAFRHARLRACPPPRSTAPPSGRRRVPVVGEAAPIGQTSRDCVLPLIPTSSLAICAVIPPMRWASIYPGGKLLLRCVGGAPAWRASPGWRGRLPGRNGWRDRPGAGSHSPPQVVFLVRESSMTASPSPRLAPLTRGTMSFGWGRIARMRRGAARPRTRLPSADRQASDP
jgi:hypothetical protein